MCRASGRRCPHGYDNERDKERRNASKQYRRDLTDAVAKQYADDQLTQLVKRAPLSSLRAVSEMLDISPDAVSKVKLPRSSTRHDTSKFLAEVTAHRASNTATVTAPPASSDRVDEAEEGTAGVKCVDCECTCQDCPCTIDACPSCGCDIDDPETCAECYCACDGCSCPETGECSQCGCVDETKPSEDSGDHEPRPCGDCQCDDCPQCTCVMRTCSNCGCNIDDDNPHDPDETLEDDEVDQGFKRVSSDLVKDDALTGELLNKECATDSCSRPSDDGDDLCYYCRDLRNEGYTPDIVLSQEKDKADRDAAEKAVHDQHADYCRTAERTIADPSSSAELRLGAQFASARVDYELRSMYPSQVHEARRNRVDRLRSPLAAVGSDGSVIYLKPGETVPEGARTMRSASEWESLGVEYDKSGYAAPVAWVVNGNYVRETGDGQLDPQAVPLYPGLNDVDPEAVERAVAKAEEELSSDDPYVRGNWHAADDMLAGIAHAEVRKAEERVAIERELQSSKYKISSDDGLWYVEERVTGKWWTVSSERNHDTQEYLVTSQHGRALAGSARLHRELSRLVDLRVRLSAVL